MACHWAACLVPAKQGMGGDGGVSKRQPLAWHLCRPAHARAHTHTHHRTHVHTTARTPPPNCTRPDARTPQAHHQQEVIEGECVVEAPHVVADQVDDLLGGRAGRGGVL